METKTIGQLTLATSALGADWIEMEIAASGLSRRIAKDNFIGAILTGGGTIATGGFGLTLGANSVINGSLVGNMTGGGTIATDGFTGTLPATGTFALRNAANTFTQRQIAPQFGTITLNLLDDTAESIALPQTRGFALITTGSGAGEHAIVEFRAEATPHCNGLVLGATAAVTTGVLSGTTGTDGRLTISAHSDGRLYIENRRNGGRAVFITILG